MYKQFGQISILTLALLLGGCGNQSGAPGEENETPEISDAELISDTKALNAEETDLEKVGLKFQISQEAQNGVLTTTTGWNSKFLNEFSKDHPEVTVPHMIAALDRYIASSEKYLVKYARFRTGNSVYTLTKKEELSAKQDVAKKTRAKLQEIVKQEATKNEQEATKLKSEREQAVANEKAALEKREQEARDSKRPIYSKSEYDSDQIQLYRESKKLEDSGVTFIYSYGKGNLEMDEAKLSQALSASPGAKADIITKSQNALAIHVAYIQKYEAFPYYVKSASKIERLNDVNTQSFDTLLKVRLGAARVRATALVELLERLERAN